MNIHYKLLEILVLEKSRFRVASNFVTNSSDPSCFYPLYYTYTFFSFITYTLVMSCANDKH